MKKLIVLQKPDYTCEMEYILTWAITFYSQNTLNESNI